MAVEYTREQLNNMSHETLVQLFLAQQDQLKEIDNKLQLLLEQVAVLNRNRFGRRSEKLGTEGQLSFTADGEIVLLFNEAEAISDAFPDEDDEEPEQSAFMSIREAILEQQNNRLLMMMDQKLDKILEALKEDPAPAPAPKGPEPTPNQKTSFYKRYINRRD